MKKFLIIFFLFLVSCSAFDEYSNYSIQNYYYEENYGQTTLFFKTIEKTSVDITFTLSEINIISDKETITQLLEKPLTINSLLTAGKQIFLSEKYVPEGKYKMLQLILKEAIIKKGDKIANMALASEVVEIPIDIYLKKGENITFFLTWQPDSSIKDGHIFIPSIFIEKPAKELLSLAIYVTNENSNNVSVINKQKVEVTNTIKVGKKPKGIITNFSTNKPRVYVVNSASNSISVIDPFNCKVEIEIPIKFGKNPEAIGIGKLNSGKNLIFVANYGSDNISIIDEMTYEEIDRVNVGSGPVAIAVDPPIENFSFTELNFEEISFLKRYREKFLNVYVANKNSNNISIIKIDSSSGRVLRVNDVKVGWNPIAMYLDYQKAKLYIANYNSDIISVINIVQIYKENFHQVSNISNVGVSVTGIVSDTEIKRLYLIKEFTDEMTIIRLFEDSIIPLRTAYIMETVPVGKSPRALILDPEARKIYVVNRGSNNITVIDKTTNKVEKVIPVGKNPYGIAFFQSK
ncbi:MAG: YncE family protein [Candidatus Aenigmatarchaeota archaeon]